MLALASLTTAWSFPDEIGMKTLVSREPEDLVAVLEVFQRDVVSHLASHSLGGMAEELFAGLLSGRVPADFADMTLMAATGWSWHTLQATPADIVQRMAIYLAVQQARETGGSLEFPDTEDTRDARPTRD